MLVADATNTRNTMYLLWPEHLKTEVQACEDILIASLRTFYLNTLNTVRKRLPVNADLICIQCEKKKINLHSFFVKKRIIATVATCRDNKAISYSRRSGCSEISGQIRTDKSAKVNSKFLHRAEPFFKIQHLLLTFHVS